VISLHFLEKQDSHVTPYFYVFGFCMLQAFDSRFLIAIKNAYAHSISPYFVLVRDSIKHLV